MAKQVEAPAYDQSRYCIMLGSGELLAFGPLPPETWGTAAAPTEYVAQMERRGHGGGRVVKVRVTVTTELENGG